MGGLTLAHTLESLRLEDGQPDLQSRKSELNSLVFALTNTEIRHLRDQLNSIALNKDICGELPLELLLVIADHLDLEDLIRVRSVSRQWSKRFSHPEFCIGVVKKHFRSVWEHQYKNLDVSTQDIAKQTLQKWLQDAVLERIRRQHGIYLSMLVYYTNDHGDVSVRQRLARERQYSNGRVAFLTNRTAITVKSLRDEVIDIFMDENRTPIKDWLLSDKFLLVVHRSPPTIIAWPLNTNGNDPTRYKVRLPNIVERYSAHHDRVGVVVPLTRDVFVWNIGGPLISLDTSKVHEQFSGFDKLDVAVLFHPFDESTTFVVNLATNNWDYSSARLHIQEFVKNIPGSIHAINLSNTRTTSLRETFDFLQGVVIISKVDPHCTMTTPEGDNAPCQHIEDDGSGPRPQDVAFVTFNIYTKLFAFQYYHIPWTPESPTRRDGNQSDRFDDSLVRDGQMLIPVCQTRTVFDFIQPLVDHNNKMLVLAINTRIDSQFRRPGLPRDKEVMPTHEQFQSFPIAFYWESECKSTISTKPAPPIEIARARGDNFFCVRGDDDFVVLFARHGFVVWCFEKDTRLPVSWSKSDSMVSDEVRNQHQESDLGFMFS